MTRATLALCGLVAVGLLGVAMAAGSCDPGYECAYTYTNLATNKQFKFDFSSLCNADQDYVANDAVGHTYSANVCGQATQECFPSTWLNKYYYGVAVQTWGSLPPCTPPGTCTDPQTKAKRCCTRDCQVLGTGDPYWYLWDDNNPDTGGVAARFKGAAPSDSDPFWCDFNPNTGAQYEREVHFVFSCDPDASDPVLVEATQNKTNDCRYELHFDTDRACANYGGMSGGWVFIILLFCLFIAYIIVGSLIQYTQTRQWGLPNREFWADFSDNVKAGFAFVGGGCKKGGSYSDVGGGAAAGGGGATFSGSSYQGSGAGAATSADDGNKEGGAYTDL